MLGDTIWDMCAIQSVKARRLLSRCAVRHVQEFVVLNMAISWPVSNEKLLLVPYHCFIGVGTMPQN